MIRINLLGVERAKVKKKVAFQVGQKLTLACSLVLIVAAVLIGWRYWTVSKESASVDAQIAKAQDDAKRLQSIIARVQQFEQQKAQLGQRVALIKQLQKDETGPVHMLDQISHALPQMLWLTNLKEGATASDVTIEGKCLNETIVTDFVANLEGSGYFKRPIEVLGTTTESLAQPPGELVKFTLKATFQPPADASRPAGAPGTAAPKTGAGN